MPSLYAVMSGADDQDRPARERRTAANAAIVSAARRLAQSGGEIPWWAIDDDHEYWCSFCVSELATDWNAVDHGPDCPAAALDAAIRAADIEAHP